MSCGCAFLDVDGEPTTETGALLVLAVTTCSTHYIDPTED